MEAQASRSMRARSGGVLSWCLDAAIAAVLFLAFWLGISWALPVPAEAPAGKTVADPQKLPVVAGEGRLEPAIKLRQLLVINRGSVEALPRLPRVGLHVGNRQVHQAGDVQAGGLRKRLLVPGDSTGRFLSDQTQYEMSPSFSPLGG